MKQVRHPNLIPIWIRTEAELSKLTSLVAEMKAVSEADPHDEPHHCSKTQEEAKEVAAKSDVLESGHLRFVQFGLNPPVNVVLTLDTFGDRPAWNLSISHGTPSGPQRVADYEAGILAKAFLGEGYQEIPPVGIHKTVRQFVKTKD